MAHIVCLTGGLTGMLNASLALVQQLQQAGHQVTYASPADLREPVTALGIPYVQLDRWVIQSGDLPMNRWQKLRSLPMRQQRAVDALGVQHFGQTLQALSPDLILIDMEMHPHIMAAVQHPLPVALLCQFLSIWRRPNLPPIHTDIVPGQGWRGQRLGIEWTWLRYSWRKWQEFQRERWRRMGIDRLSILRCYARQLDYPWRDRWGHDQWLVPAPHGQLPILCFNALELDFPHEPHPLMHYVGPMVLVDRPESQVEAATHIALEQLFAGRESGERSLIYCACSTFAQANRQFLKQLMAAVADCPHWDLVLGLGGQLDPSDLGDLPVNVHAFGWVPQLQVLKHADCAINNGGINSINECLYLGVPMLVYSLRRFDQNGNAARIAYHGLGLVGDIASDDATQIRDHLQTLLTDAAYQTRVHKMRDRMHQYRQANRAAQTVAALLKALPREAIAVPSPGPLPYRTCEE
ncbi:MAG: nucleotide disphospho-sugar-binding domain-containing protein [Cyanobacteria bacterium J06559_3]